MVNNFSVNKAKMSANWRVNLETMDYKLKGIGCMSRLSENLVVEKFII